MTCYPGVPCKETASGATVCAACPDGLVGDGSTCGGKTKIHRSIQISINSFFCLSCALLRQRQTITCVATISIEFCFKGVPTDKAMKLPQAETIRTTYSLTACVLQFCNKKELCTRRKVKTVSLRKGPNAQPAATFIIIHLQVYFTHLSTSNVYRHRSVPFVSRYHSKDAFETLISVNVLNEGFCTFASLDSNFHLNYAAQPVKYTCKHLLNWLQTEFAWCGHFYPLRWRTFQCPKKKNTVSKLLSDSLSGLFLVPTSVPPTSAEKEDPFPGKCKKLSPCKGR